MGSSILKFTAWVPEQGRTAQQRLETPGPLPAHVCVSKRVFTLIAATGQVRGALVAEIHSSTRLGLFGIAIHIAHCVHSSTN